MLSGGIDASNIDSAPASTKKTSQAPAKATSATSAKEQPKATASSAAPKATATDSYPVNEAVNDYKGKRPSYAVNKVESPKATVTAAPAPTQAPENNCKEGYVCVTVSHVEVVTQYVTVTADYNEYQRRNSGAHVRRRQARR